MPQEESNLHPVVEIDCFVRCKFPMIALLGFDPRSSWLWARHASSAPKCYVVRSVGIEPTRLSPTDLKSVSLDRSDTNAIGQGDWLRVLASCFPLHGIEYRAGFKLFG